MTKSIYSLLLSDAVVRELDRKAYETGLSRSALANRILAEALSYITPEQRMRDVFSAMEDIFNRSVGFQLASQPSDSMFSLRSALEFKYNPSVKYSVELYGGEPKSSGRLTVRLRSQNNELLSLFTRFFEIWHGVETVFSPDVEACISPGKYEREIKGFGGRELNESETGAYISDYIMLLDGAVKYYFSDPSSQSIKTVITQNYSDFINKNKEVLL